MPSRKDSPAGPPGRKYTRGASSHADSGLSYSQADAALLRDVVATVTDAGDAVLFGRTSDGGALVAHFMSAGHLEKVYAASVEELDTILQTALEMSAPS